MGHAHELGLATVLAATELPTAFHAVVDPAALAVEALAAEGLAAHGHAVAGFEGVHALPHLLDNAHELVAEHRIGHGARHGAVNDVQVARADGRARDADNCVGWGLQLRLGAIIERDMSAAVVYQGFHETSLRMLALHKLVDALGGLAVVVSRRVALLALSEHVRRVLELDGNKAVLFVLQPLDELRSACRGECLCLQERAPFAEYCLRAGVFHSTIVVRGTMGSKVRSLAAGALNPNRALTRPRLPCLPPRRAPQQSRRRGPQHLPLARI